MEPYDLIIIGGGINGAGIAREAASRGLKVALFEKNDFGDATTAGSTRLIHGGLRYLEHGELGLVRESLRERKVLFDTAPHLVKPLALLIPIYRHRRLKYWVIKVGMVLYDLFSKDRTLPSHRAMSRREIVEAEPGLKRDDLTGGFIYYDGQVAFPERLVLENLLSARSHGAVLYNHTRIIGFIEREGRVRGVAAEDLLTGKSFEAAADAVINASGPWADRVRNLGVKDIDREVLDPLLGGTKGSHIVLPLFSDKAKFGIYSPAISDGRPFFVLPWDGRLLVGTTDVRTQESPDGLAASESEVQYLLNETNALFTRSFRREDILFAYAAMRPLPRSKKPEGAVTRRHKIIDHGNGLFSIVGGKLTTYRSLSEQTLRLLERKKIVKTLAPSHTRVSPLWGAPAHGGKESWSMFEKQWPSLLAQQYGLEGSQVAHLMSLYGIRVKEVLDLVRVRPALKERLCPFQPDIAAQTEHAATREMAGTLADFCLRRTAIGLRGCRGLDCAENIARALGAPLGWNQERVAREVEEYKEEIKRKYSVTNP